MAELTRAHPVARWVTGAFGLAVASALAGASGCSSSGGSTSPNGNSTNGLDSPDGGMGSTDASIGCVGDPRGETFMPNMTHKGTSGMLSFVIVNSSPYDPPAVANNTWTMKILDASGQPVKDAVLTFPKQPNSPSDPWMPDHSHGAAPAKAMNNNDGTYTVAPLYFFMGGIWSTFIQAQVGSVTDSTKFTFCIGS